MNRRDVLKLAGGALALPLAAMMPERGRSEANSFLLTHRVQTVKGDVFGVKEGRWVYLKWIDDEWVIVAAEC